MSVKTQPSTHVPHTAKPKIPLWTATTEQDTIEDITEPFKYQVFLEARQLSEDIVHMKHRSWEVSVAEKAKT